MSWAAHQFEGYVLQRHFGERFGVSYLGIVAGDALPDFVAKAWVYGVTIDGHHYGAAHPADFHRSWPGAGFSHSLLFGVLIGAALWRLGRRHAWAVPWALGVIIGQWAHVITDINDSKGTMLLFPFTTHNFSLGTWAYGAQVGKYDDAAAYFSSLGFVMDVSWFLVVVLFVRRVLTRRYFETTVVPADPAAWRWLAQHTTPSVPLVIYRSLFVYGAARVVAWSWWAHAVEHFAWDLRWGGPSWLTKVPPSRQSWSWAVVGVAGVGAALVLFWWVALRRRTRSGATCASAVVGGSR
jgi:membrane-bound metal-dependent hydrolase YbcI (DUF457 family)